MSNIINEQKKGYDHYQVMNGLLIPSQTFPSTEKLSPGIYQIFQDPQSGKIFFLSMSTLTDGLISLPSHISEKVIQDVNKFWSPETRQRFEKYNMVYKRGVLLHGAPGTGKTVITTKIMEQVVREGGLVFFDAKPKLLHESVGMIKEIQGDVRILAVYEEFDSWIENDSSFLSLLDGELQIENIVYLATTNYIDRIPPRIRNRPSRFANVIEVGFPDANVRRSFLEGKLGKGALTETELEAWVNATDQMSLDHLKDLIISVLCIGTPLDEAIAKLKTMNSEDVKIDANNLWEVLDEIPEPRTGAVLLQQEYERILRKERRDRTYR